MSDGVLFPSLALREDQAFEAVLTDIPLFCVGLMAMGLITFVFIMKRINLTTLYLCSASLLLFISAILDLGQLLIREPTEKTRAFDTDVVAGFVVAREVGLGLSHGFLFLFVWRAVAECPNDERPQSLIRPIKHPSSKSHSASWTRWGVLGSLLKWSTLVLVIVIPLLQILWRLVTAQRQYGSVYIADSTLQIVGSAIFVLKVILNVLVSPSAWWPPFRSYIGLVAALFITGAMGVGNLVSFAFSETILGRFLRAISVYVLLLWNLIAIFHLRNVTRQPIDDPEKSQGLTALEKPKDMTAQEKGTGISQPTERTLSIIDLARSVSASAPQEARRPSLRVSAASRLSVIVNRVEKNETLAELTRSMSARSSRKSSLTPITPKRPRRPDLHFDIITPSLPSTAENPDSPSEPPTTGVSLSYYTTPLGVFDTPIVRDPPVNPAKPSVYQVDEQENSHSTSQASLLAHPPSHNPSITSFEELMRQQNELDRSIAKLRLLSVDAATLPLPGPTSARSPERSSVTGDTSASTKSRPQSTLRTESLSPHSEFSFSAFPIPPPPPQNLGLPDRFPRPTVRKLPVPPRPEVHPIAPLLSVPESPSQSSMVARMVSGGTQYDVTSFIGNLTEPEEPIEGLGEQETSATDETLKDVKNEQETGRSRTSSEDSNDPRASKLKPMLLPVVASERKAVPLPAVRPSRSGSQLARSGPRDSSTMLKPFLLGTSATSVPVLLPSSTMVPLGSRHSSRAARVPAHKSRISVPRLNTSDTLDEVAPETFERPRPPPVVSGLTQPRPKA